MPAKKRVSDAELIRVYKKTGSVWATGDVVGIRGGSVHERLKKLGVSLKFPKWTSAEDAILIESYGLHRNAGTLEDLAATMGRTKPFICRQARRLGLTDQKGKKPYACVWKGMSKEEARKHFDEFRESGLGSGEFCRIKSFDDLGFATTMRRHFRGEWDDWLARDIAGDSTYHTGRNVEYQVLDDLRKRGYFVFLSPGSKGPVDLVAIKTGVTLLVQAKKGMTLYVTAWNALYDLAISVGAVPVLAGTAGDLKYKQLTARKTGRKTKQPMADLTP